MDRTSSSCVADPNHFQALKTVNQRNDIKAATKDIQVPYMIPGTGQYQFISISQAFFRERVLFINRPITTSVSNELIAILLYLRNEDKDKPITLYCNIPGGERTPTMALYDTIEACKKDCSITTLNLGFCAGLGALITASGSPGRRYALPNSRFLLTTGQPGEVVRGQAEDIKEEVMQKVKMNDRVEEVIARLTGRERGRVKKDFRRDFYLDAKEAKEYGIIDKVLMAGEDEDNGEAVGMGKFANKGSGFS